MHTTEMEMVYLRSVLHGNKSVISWTQSSKSWAAAMYDCEPGPQVHPVLIHTPWTSLTI